MTSSMTRNSLAQSVPAVGILHESRGMRRCWILGFTLSKKTALYFSEIEGAINLTVDIDAAQQFDTLDDAETYLGMLHQEHPKFTFILNKLKVIPHGFV